MARIAVEALDGAHINVQRWGNGPAVLALHGFTGASDTWRPLAEGLGGVHEVVAVDVIGHGESDAPEDAALYTVERVTGALREIIERLGLGQVCWLGYSMGGRLALRAALDLPRQTWGVVLESASPGIVSEVERAERVRADERLADWAEDVGIQGFVDYWEALPLWASQRRLTDDVRSRLRAERLAQRPRGLANSLRGMGTGVQEPLHNRLQELAVPALLVAGAEDAKFSEAAKAMAGAISGSHLELIAEAGHAVHLEQPARFLQAVRDFLRTAAPAELRPRSLPSP